MNEEQPTNEAEAKKSGNLAASIERMTACLEDVYANAKAALDQMPLMPHDGMKWMTLSKAVFDIHERTRLGWQKLVDPPPTIHDPAAGTGAFFTSPEVLGAIGAAPWKPLDIPELDISFKRFYSASYQVYIAAWNNGCDAHVYALTVERVREDWFAIAANDGHEVFRLSCNSKFLAARIGLAAMRAYLIRGHRRTWRRARAAAVAAAVPEVPTVTAVPTPSEAQS